MSKSNTTSRTTVEPVAELRYWTSALNGAFGPVHENDPQSGYWRTKPDRSGRSSAVAIWRHEGKVLALRDGRPVDPCDVWTWCCHWPITYDAYRRVAEEGEDWPDAIPSIGHNSGAVVPAKGGREVVRLPADVEVQTSGQGQASRLPESQNHASQGPASQQLVPGSEGTSPPVADPTGPDRLAGDIGALWEHATSWLSSIGSVVTQEMADRAANFAARFAQLAADAEMHRTRLKRPILQQAAAIDAMWKPIVERAEQARAAMKAAVEPYLEAEWHRLDASGRQPDLDPPAAGTQGRRLTLRSESRVEVNSVKALVRHYAGDGRFQGDAQVQKVTQKLALSDLSSGTRVPGAKLIGTRKIG